MTVLDRRPVTTALVGWLATATGKPCGDHRLPTNLPAAPTTPGKKPDPYSIVYALDGGGYWGPGLVAPDQAADWLYQVTSVGYSPAQVQWLADAVKRTLLARSASGAFQVAFPAVTGVVIADRMPPEGSGAGGIDIAGKHPDEVFSIPERYVLRAVPA